MRSTVTVALALLGGVGCGRVDFGLAPPVDGGGGGGGAGDGAGDGALAACGPWQAPVHLASVSSTNTDWGPALDPTGLVLVFHSDRAGLSFELYAAVRPSLSADFGDAVALTGLNTSADEGGAYFTGDGTTLYFNTQNGMQRASHLGGTSFGPPVGATDTVGFDGALSSDDLELFTTEFISMGDLDVIHATRPSTSAAWVIDADAAALNRFGAIEGWPTFDHRQQTLYFERDLAGDAELARATRPGPDQPFGPPELVTEFDQPGVRYADPVVSADGTMLLFSATLPGSLGAHDLYQSTRVCP